MPMVGRNIIANLIGGLILTAMVLVLTPLQIRLLGMESFGIIGFITALQVAFTAFDMGLSSTLTRELAADASHEKRASIPLVQTALTIYWCCAVVLGIILWNGAEPLARRWFNATALPPSVIVESLRVIALYLALRWPVAVYAGILTGVQQMTSLNVIKVTVLSVRMAGGILVLLIEPSLPAFLWWTAISALVEVVVYDLACRRLVRGLSARPGFSLPALRQVWRFSASMNLLAVLAVLIVQADRVLISKLLPLEALGSYNLAYTAASALVVLVNAVSTAVMPSLAATHRHQERHHLDRKQEQADLILLYLVTPAAGALIFYGEQILSLWVGHAAAVSAATATAFLAAGFWVSAAIANVYNGAIAAGNPGKHLRANLLGAAPYCVLLYYLILRFGIEGAGAAWLLLNLGYAAILVPIVQRTVLKTSTPRWFFRIVLPFAVLGFASFLMPAWALRAWGNSDAGATWPIALVLSGLLWAAAAYPLGLLHHLRAFYIMAWKSTTAPTNE